MLKDKYINPLTDFGFKKLFGSEPNKDLLIDFLNQIIPDYTIEDLTYGANEHVGKNAMDRKVVYDIYCKGTNGERFIVEMQKAKQNYFKDRSVYYASFPIQEQGVRSEWNYKLDPVYNIGILDFVFDDHKNENEFLHTVSLKDQNCNEFYKKLKFIYIELPKFNKKEAELETPFDKWLYVLKCLPNLNDRPKALQERVFKKLFAAAEIAKYSRSEKEQYEHSLKVYRDIKNVADTYFDEGKIEGKIEGEQIGLEKGEQIGIQKEKEKAACKMINDGLSLDIVSKYTGLSIDRLQNLDH